MTHVLENEDLVAEVFEWLDLTIHIFIESVSRCFRRACLRSWSRRFSNLPTMFNAYTRIESKQRKLTHAHVHAARLGSVACLEWLERFVYFKSWTLGHDFVEACCRVGNDRVVDWLFAKDLDHEHIYAYLSECIKRGNVAAFRTLYPTHLSFFDRFELSRCAIERGRLDLVNILNLSSIERNDLSTFNRDLSEDIDRLIGLGRAIQARDESVPNLIRRLRRPDTNTSSMVLMLIHGPDVRWGIEMFHECLPQNTMPSAAHMAFEVERERGRDPVEFLRWYAARGWALSEDLLLDALLEPGVDKALLDQIIKLPAPIDFDENEVYTDAFCQLYDSDRIWALEHYIRKLGDESADTNDRDAILTRIGSFLARRQSKKGFATVVARCNDVHLLESFASPDRGILTPDDFPVTLAYNALWDCRWDILFWCFSRRPDRSYLTDSMRAPYMVFLACKSHGS